MRRNRARPPIVWSHVIRPATAADAAGVARLATQLGYPSDAEDIARRLDAVLASGTLLVAIRDGAVAGWIHVGLVPHITSDNTARILGLVVDEALRSGGIGKALVEAAEAWARAAGAPTITVKSSVHRTRTHAFYLRAGYAEVKRQIAFRKRLT